MLLIITWSRIIEGLSVWDFSWSAVWPDNHSYTTLRSRYCAYLNCDRCWSMYLIISSATDAGVMGFDLVNARLALALHFKRLRWSGKKRPIYQHPPRVSVSVA